jgi:hypothetical protein
MNEGSKIGEPRYSRLHWHWASNHLPVLLAVVLIVITLSCNSIFPTQTKPDLPKDHTRDISGVMHKAGLTSPLDRNVGCAAASCHGSDLKGGVATGNGRKVVAPSCTQCHGALWEGGGNGEETDD